MSDNITWLVDLDASSEEAKELAERVSEWLISQRIVSQVPCQATNTSHLLSRGESAATWDAFPYPAPVSMCGLEVVTDRRVFHTGGHGIDSITCPSCARQHHPDSLPWSDAVGAWFEGDADDRMACPACQQSRSIADWEFDRPWAFGNLGFGFWNWPIDERLLDEVSAMTGHRLRVVQEHI